MNSGRILLATLLLSVLAATPAVAETWTVVSGDDATEVVFESRATMESFKGRTHAVSGWIRLDSPDSIAWYVEVDLADLDTGIGLRNRHMRENHLHTGEFPVAVFEGSQAVERVLPGSAITLALAGDLTLHGVTVARTIDIRFLVSTDGELTASAEFPISLADHEIPRPGFLMMKLADVQKVRVQLLARPTPEETP